MKYVQLSLILATLASFGQSKVICSKEEYVRSGLEFLSCQEATLKSFHAQRKAAATSRDEQLKTFNPCPSLKHIVYSCVEIARHCFDARGWERGRQVRSRPILLHPCSIPAFCRFIWSCWLLIIQSTNIAVFSSEETRTIRRKILGIKFLRLLRVNFARSMTKLPC